MPGNLGLETREGEDNSLSLMGICNDIKYNHNLHVRTFISYSRIDQNCAAASGTGTKSISSKVYY